MNYAQLLLPDFSLILGGYLICRYTALNRTVGQPVESLVYYLLFPVLLLQSIVKSLIDLNAASTCYVLAARMGYNGPYVAGLVTLSTLLGLVSLPFALGVLR